MNEPARVEEEVTKLRGQPLPHLDAIRSAADPLAAVRDHARMMVSAAHRLDAPPIHEAARLDLRAHEATSRLLTELEALARPRRRGHPRGDRLAARPTPRCV